MASTGMGKSYPLDLNSINRIVAHTSPGVYALGYEKDGSFYIERTGRADEDVKERLKDHVGKFRLFKFAFCDSATHAYEWECRLFHDFPTAPGNKIHPGSPAGTNLICSICGQ